MEMFIRSNFSDIFFFFSTFSFNIYICKINFLNKYFKTIFLLKIGTILFFLEISKQIGMVPIVFTFPENFEPYSGIV